MNAQPMSADELLERRIEQARLRMTHAQSTDERREAYEDMRGLISQRSPEQVARMEIAKGLRQ